MRKSLRFLLIVIFITGMVSCQKEFAIEDLPAGTTPSTGNNGSDSKDSYQPLSKDSYWKYKDSLTGTITTQTATAITKTFDNRTYTAIANSDGTNTDTIYSANNLISYYSYGEVGNGSSSGSFLFHYLNDTVPVGQSWEYLAGQGNGIDVHIKATVIKKGMSVTVNNFNYTNVVHTDLELSYDMIGPVIKYEFYVAKGVGIIKVRSRGVGLTQGFESCTDLIEYKIK